MEPTTVPPRIYRFGPFELSRDTAELRKNGIRLKLQEQPFQILCTLLDHPGELVTREHPRQQLWPDGTFVDFEHSLNTAIKKLRDVLSDDAEVPRYIETVPRKGYRFIAPLTLEGKGPQGDGTSLRNGLRPRKWQFLLGIVLVCAVTVSGYLLWRPHRLTVFATKQLTFTGDLAFMKFHPIQTDGRRVYYSKLSQSRIFSVPVHGGEETSFETNLRDPVLMHISPDGSSLLVREFYGPSGGMENRVWVVPTNGSPARPLGDVEARTAAWSPDGASIVFAKESAVFLTDIQAFPPRKLFNTRGEVTFLRWSPDGHRIALTVTDPQTTSSSLWESVNGNLPQPLALNIAPVGDVCCGDWTHDARFFFFRRAYQERIEYWYIDQGMLPLGIRRPVLLTTGTANVRAATASPLENTVFIAAQEFRSFLLKFYPETRKTQPFLPEFSGINAFFSTDQKWMVVCQFQNDESVLWRARTDGTDWLQLADARLFVYSGQFSPDGMQIIFMGQRSGQPWKIYLVSREGGSLHELDAAVVNQADPNWMPDGQSIIFGQPPRYFGEPHDPRAIYSYNLRTKALAKLAGSEGWYSPRLSPDGRQVLALSIDEHKLGLHDLGTDRWRVIVDDPKNRIGNPFWSPDGQWAYANLYDIGITRVRLRDGHREDVLSTREIARAPGCWANGFAPDNSILINCPIPKSDIYSLKYN
jgi:Tol biopolymer transport system component/DNA-binding winged helix-turn-helix (wHTH) protein